jgi:pimeloyl-ACP methyl ester carboxylesterase
LYATGRLRAQLRKYHGDNTDCAFLGWSGVWVSPSFIDWNIEQYLLGIDIPLLTFRGADDPYNTAWHVETIRQTVSSSVVHYELPESGHSPHVDAFQVVMGSIGDFVEAHE